MDKTPSYKSQKGSNQVSAEPSTKKIKPIAIELMSKRKTNVKLPANF